MPVVEPVDPRLTVAGALGVKARNPGPVRLKRGTVIVTIALFVPTMRYLAAWGVPTQVTLPLQPVRTPAWFMLITWPYQAPEPDRTRGPKQRFCTKEMVRGLK